MDRRSVASDGTSTVTSRILIQNGSFFYPKKAGFRRTAVYTAAFGEKSLKKYMHGPGGKASVHLGSDKATKSSTIRDSYRKSANKAERDKVEKLVAAGSLSDRLSSVSERKVKLVQPPGGSSKLKLGGEVDENPAAGGVLKTDMAEAVSSPKRREADSKGRAGITCTVSGASPPPKPAKRPMQNVGGDDTVWLGPEQDFPKHSLMGEDLKLAHDPRLKQAADELPRRGVTSKSATAAATVTRKRNLRAGGGEVTLDLKDASDLPMPASSLWEEDVQRKFTAEAQQEVEDRPAAGERVPERPPCLRVSHVTGGTSTITLQYALERDNISAAMSPVRPKFLPLNAKQTHGGVRRVSGVKAADCVGPSIIGGIQAANSMYQTTYQAASTGVQPHESRPRRSLVKRVQDVGGRTTVSLRDDADAAGVRTKLEPAVNPITARAPNPITAPPPPMTHTGRRLVKTMPLPDQVAITTTDLERIKSREARRRSIRRVAPPGGKSTVSLS